MALADSVPGVSGGTIAFLLGFYDKFINSINALISKDKEARKDAIKFLVKLGIGWVVGMVLAVLILAHVFESQIYAVSSVFLGFIVFAIPIVIKEEKEALKKNYLNIIFTIIGIGIVVAITLFNPMSGTEASIDVSNLNIGLIIYVFLVAMVAISAMVLPRNIWFNTTFNIWAILTNNKCNKRTITSKFCIFTNTYCFWARNNCRCTCYNKTNKNGT